MRLFVVPCHNVSLTHPHTLAITHYLSLAGGYLSHGLSQPIHLLRGTAFSALISRSGRGNRFSPIAIATLPVFLILGGIAGRQFVAVKNKVYYITSRLYKK